MQWGVNAKMLVHVLFGTTARDGRGEALTRDGLLREVLSDYVLVKVRLHHLRVGDVARQYRLHRVVVPSVANTVPAVADLHLGGPHGRIFGARIAFCRRCGRCGSCGEEVAQGWEGRGVRSTRGREASASGTDGWCDENIIHLVDGATWRGHQRCRWTMPVTSQECARGSRSACCARPPRGSRSTRTYPMVHPSETLLSRRRKGGAQLGSGTSDKALQTLLHEGGGGRERGSERAGRRANR